MQAEDESGVGTDYQHLRQRATRRGRGTGTNGGPVPLPLVGKTHHRNDMQIPCQSADNFQNSCNSLCLKGLRNMR